MAGSALRVGDKAPDFEVTSSAGRTLRLRDLLGKKNVVLYFYPGDFTPICTKETCGFRDMLASLGSETTEIIGVSADSDESHRRFASEHNVPFDLVADERRELAKAYGATGFLRDILGKVARKTFVIDKQGRIAAILEGELRASKHVDGVRDALRRLS